LGDAINTQLHKKFEETNRKSQVESNSNFREIEQVAPWMNIHAGVAHFPPK